MYKVFFNDSLLTLTTPELVPKEARQRRMGSLGRKQVGQAILEFEKSGARDYFLSHPDADLLFEIFGSFYHNMEAAGGLVRHENGKYLFIKRFGKWDLPKGKIEAGESPDEAALREVLEECGISAMLNQALPSTYHIYTLDGTRILKRTWWFSMSYSGEPATVPQLEEGITEAVWLVPSRFDMVLDNTYRSLTALLEDIPWEEQGLRTC